MPLTPSYDWDETADSVRLYIQLKGKSPNEVDLFASDLYVKVNFNPYLLEVDLRSAITEDASTARFKKGVLTVKLTKASPGLWGELFAEGDKAALKQRRAESFGRKEAKDAAARESVKDRRREEERTTLRSQMGLEEDERQHIEGVREEIKQEFERDMYETLARAEAEHDEKVTAIMTAAEAVVCVNPSDDIFRASKIMSKRNIRVLPVIETTDKGRRLRGVIAIEDLLRWHEEQAPASPGSDLKWWR